MHTSAKGKYVRFEIDVWFNPDTGHLHITSNDPDISGFHTTVNSAPESKRCHQNLFMKLSRVLRAAGKPAPAGELPLRS